jgi:small subunit ribosomal protein S9
LDPIAKAKVESGKVVLKWNIEVRVTGGGTHSQAEAVRHGLSRALVSSDHELRAELKTFGFLKRDPRAKERRKFGLKKARKAPQWSKR